MTEPKPTLELVGAELRQIAGHLESVAAHVCVAAKALEAQDADADVDVATVLRVSVSSLLYSQTRRLARLASKCDGRPDDDADDDLDDDEVQP
jgi:hypothetical protein